MVSLTGIVALKEAGDSLREKTKRNEWGGVAGKGQAIRENRGKGGGLQAEKRKRARQSCLIFSTNVRLRQEGSPKIHPGEKGVNPG